MVLRGKKRNYNQGSVKAGAWTGRWMEWCEVYRKGSFFRGNA